jgi:hypothetical protein
MSHVPEKQHCARPFQPLLTSNAGSTLLSALTGRYISVLTVHIAALPRLLHIYFEEFNSVANQAQCTHLIWHVLEHPQLNTVSRAYSVAV